MLRPATLTLLVTLLGTAPVLAESVTPSNGSNAISQGSAMIVGGSATLLVDGADLVVTAASAIGERIDLVLRGSVHGVETTLRLSTAAAGAASIGVGAVLTVSTDVTGAALLAGGRMVAYVPNAVGRSLIYHARLDTVR
ncbi:hypothetical protein EV699_106210 [Plasticicumulans lactativorans]|uniref:DUF4402 domain-containing protein n=1 Tax=Plasticicumulans lactativorans TaxID=1133106 RepID=A0A4R2L9S1_9GAMM|nr:hypothetical protein [Plasticicumulans lactativorans]TCO82113.1 hypothetical protein EV699_106210 [Plasticicumulans lactativorans]